MTQNQLTYMANLEQGRHNYATETEINRSNIANEQETKRSHIANETETHRSNVANETETKRSHLANESENQRTNLANEQIKREQTQASIQNAQTAAAATIAAAQINAATQQYIAQLNAYVSELMKKYDQQIAAGNNQTARIIQMDKSATEKYIANLKHITDVIGTAQNVNSNNVKNQLTKLGMQIQSDYNKGKLSLEAYRTLKDAFESYADRYGITKSDFGKIFTIK